MAALQTLAFHFLSDLSDSPSESGDRIVARASIGGIQRPEYYQGLRVTIGSSPDAILPLAYFIPNAS